MKILFASDSFKGCLDSLAAGRAMADGVKDACESKGVETPEIEVIEMADGGEGTAVALAHAVGAEWVEVETLDARKTPMKSGFFISPDGHTAYLDVASASGLGRLAPELRDLHETTSYGTGLLLEAARQSGVSTIVIGLGGSSTIDLGIGILQAIGVKFFDESGLFIEEPICGKDLVEVVGYAITDEFRKRWRKVEIVLLSDVATRLTGSDGAVAVFGPQKGLKLDEIEDFSNEIEDLGRMFHRESFDDVNDVPGSGAAGGIYVGLKILGNVRICNGGFYLLDCLQIKEILNGCDLLLTGEGCSDRQTLMGKGPFQVMKIGRECGVPVVLLSGNILDREMLEDAGFADVININEIPMKSGKIDESEADNPLNPKVASSRLRTAAKNIVAKLIENSGCY